MQDSNSPDFNWKQLQNGSDIRGVAIAGVPNEPVNLTPTVAQCLGQAFTTWLSAKVGKPASALQLAIGRDSRRSGPELMQSVMYGITATGASVYDFAMASTPAMFMSTVTPGFDCDGAIMMTASHLPYNRNGLKFFTAQGGLGKADISAILTLAEQSADSPEPGTRGTITPRDFISVYADQLVQKIRTAVNHPEQFEQPLKGLKIIVDAGNGAGGFYASKVLEPLGADTTGSQFLEPDGMFPNHIPNPEDGEAMASICAAVKANQADFGIIFDTDVDRSAAVDHEGRELNRNRLIALISAIVLQEHPGSTIVTDSITSDGLAQFIEGELGGKHHRFKRGYKNVINEAVRLNDAGEESWLAIETSGHGAMRENYFLDDGAYLVSKLLIELARAKQKGESLTQLIAPLKEPAESEEYRLKIQADDFKACGQGVIDQLRGFVAAQPDWSVVPNNHEGIRVACASPQEDGWFLLRLSLHDPVLPLNIESNVAGGVGRIRDRLRPFFESNDSLNLPAAFAGAASVAAGGPAGGAGLSADPSGELSGGQSDRYSPIPGGLGIMLATTAIAIAFVGFSLFVETVQSVMNRDGLSPGIPTQQPAIAPPQTTPETPLPTEAQTTPVQPEPVQPEPVQPNSVQPEPVQEIPQPTPAPSVPKAVEPTAPIDPQPQDPALQDQLSTAAETQSKPSAAIDTPATTEPSVTGEDEQS